MRRSDAPSLGVRVRRLGLAAAALFCLASDLSAEPIPTDARAFSVADFGAFPDDGIDDTQAIRDALAVARIPGSDGKIVYIPAGVYDVSDALVINPSRDSNRVTLIGEDSATTVIRLRAAALGYGDPELPKAVVQTTSFPSFTAVQFRQSIQDLTVEVGPGNPGAIGVDFHTNNQGFLRNVTVVGDGVVGISLAGNDRGPGMLSGVTVEGFTTGIDAPGTEYSWVLEDVALYGQSREGIRNVWNILTIRGLTSNNTVPVLVQDVGTVNNFRWAMCTLIDGALNGGETGTPALVANGSVYLRNVTSTGYGSLIEQEGVAAAFTDVSGEWTSDVVQRLHTGTDTMLNLPIANVPPLQAIGPDAVSAEMFGADGLDGPEIDDAPAIQAAIDSGAAVVYLPSGKYHLASTVVLRGGVTRIAGLTSSVQAIDDLADLGGPLFTTEGNVQVTLDNLSTTGTGAYTVTHPGPGMLALRNIRRGASDVWGGEFFLEDVVGGPHRVAAPAKAWYRQLNPENEGIKLTNEGADVVVLGMKTEKDGRLLQNNGGRTEILGGLAYPLNVSLAEPMFVNVEGEFSAIIGESAYGSTTPTRMPDYKVIVDDTRSGELRRITDGEVPTRLGFGFGSRVSFFTSNVDLPPAPDPPYAHFSFDLVAGNRTTSAVGGFDASLEDGAVTAAGFMGNGIQFDGTSWLFFTPDAPTLPLTTQAGAVELWLNSDVALSDSAMLFYAAARRVSGPNGFGSDREMHIHFNADGTIGFFVESVGGDVNVVSRDRFNDGSWHHVVASWDATGRADLYVDGVRRGSSDGAFDAYSLESVVLARTNSNNRRYTGRIDEVALWDRPVVHSEVISRFNAGRGFANYAPIVEAGTDQVVQTSTLSWPSDAQVNDDGQPFDQALQTEWTTVTGPGSVNLDGPDPVRPVFTFSNTGEYLLQLSADDGLEVASDRVLFTVFEPLPEPWRNDDVNAAQAGWAITPDGAAFSVNGGGSRIGGSSASGGDSFHFVYQEVFGTTNVEIAATVYPPVGGADDATVGIMFRGGQREYVPAIDLQVISQLAENCFIGLTSAGDLVYQWRAGNNGGTTRQTIASDVTGPVHLRLVRVATNRFRAFFSLDCGGFWTELEEITVNRGQAQIYAGLAVAGGGGIATGQFDSVSVRMGAPGDVNADTRLDVLDLIDLLVLFDAGDLSADLNGDGALSEEDVLTQIELVIPPCTVP